MAKAKIPQIAKSGMPPTWTPFWLPAHTIAAAITRITGMLTRP
jgi:hypothetical protein